VESGSTAHTNQEQNGDSSSPVPAEKGTIARLREVIVALLAVASGGVALALGNQDVRPADIWLAIGGGLVPAALLSFVYLWVVRPAQADAEQAGFSQLTSAVNQHVSTSVSQLYNTLREEKVELNEFAPSRIFPESGVPDPSLNGELMDHLRGTRHVHFKGLTGQWMASRLKVVGATGQLQEVSLQLAHPQCRTAIRDRLWEEKGGAKTDYKESDVDDVCLGVARAVVGLFDCRPSGTKVNILLLEKPPLDRVEMFDEAMYVSFFSDRISRGALYPRTARFEKHSPMYKSKSRAFAEAASRDVMVFDDQTTEADLVQHLQRCFGVDYPLAQLRSGIDKFAGTKRDALGSVAK
jgi:hypothetical protein